MTAGQTHLEDPRWDEDQTALGDYEEEADDVE